MGEAGKVVDAAFKTSPDTVFGILTGFLVIVIMALIYALTRIYKENQKTNREYREKIIEITTMSITVMEKSNQIHEKQIQATEKHSRIVDRLTDMVSKLKLNKS